MSTLPDPPAALPVPRTTTITTGTKLWRIHSTTRRPNTPNPTAQPSPRRGGRFDSLDGSYAYLYLGDTPNAAVAETLCRNLPVDQTPRLLPHSQIAGRSLTELEILTELHVADLTGTGSARINAGSWLTHSDPSGYLTTRRWATAILTAHPHLAGLQYRPRHNDNQIAWMLATPTADDHQALAATWTVQLDTPQGRALLTPLLAEHNAALPLSP